MVNCLDCNIEVKLDYCCGSHPDTGISQALKLEDGLNIQACPNLNPYGDCGIYSDRPQPCIDYQCPSLRQTDLVDIFAEYLIIKQKC